MYRNCYYDSRTSIITEWTWNADGDRITLETPFQPFLMVETELESNIKSVYGTNLKMKSFKNGYERTRFIDDYDGRVFFSVRPEQQYLIGKYRNAKDENWMKNDLRIFTFDIECPARDEFPDPELARHEIDVMTIHDSLTNIYHVWGNKPYDESNITTVMKSLGGNIDIINEDQIRYYEIADEKTRLVNMVDFWEKNCPDILTGWNSEGFDVPYLINRIKLVCKGTHYKRLSPVNKVTTREYIDKFKNPRIGYKLHGISSLDYMLVFQSLTFSEKESWKLDAIASEVLGCGKLELDGVSLYDLARSDWDKYTNYNIIDVAILVNIDKKQDYFTLIRNLVYAGYGNPADALGKVIVLSGAIYARGMDERTLPETKPLGDSVKFEGGYVKEPDAGIYEGIASFDATSLYPSLAMTMNMSHETIVGEVVSRSDGYTFLRINGESYKKADADLMPFLIKNKLCLSKADVIFSQHKEGLIKKVIKSFFDKKQKNSALAKKAKADGDEELAKRYASLTLVAKVFVNSIYGILSTAKSPMYDLRIARSITLSGQAMIKKTASIVDDYASSIGVDIGKGGLTIAGDTDSIMVGVYKIANHFDSKMVKDGEATEFGIALCDQILTPVINKNIDKWARENIGSIDPWLSFEREKIASACFYKKKQYSYFVFNNEGFVVPHGKRMTFTGLKPNRSEYSEFVKDMMRETYRIPLVKYFSGKAECEKELKDKVQTYKGIFISTELANIAKRQRANNIRKFEDGFVSRYKAGLHCPAQVSVSIIHNRLIKDLGLGNKYTEIQSGDKIMWVYVKPNKYKVTGCALSGGVLPPEFGLEADLDMMFNKLYMPVATQVFGLLGFRMPNMHYEEAADLDDLLRL